jgi:hypothetical protein
MRRFWSVLLISVGAALTFLATEAWVGTVLVVLGLSIEVIGITIKQKQK